MADIDKPALPRDDKTEDKLESDFGAVPKDWNKAPPDQRDEINPSATPKFRLKDRGKVGDDVTDPETDLEPVVPGAKLEPPKPVTKGDIVDDDPAAAATDEPTEGGVTIDSYSDAERESVQKGLAKFLNSRDVGKHQQAFTDAIAQVKNPVERVEVKNLISAFPKKAGTKEMADRIRRSSRKGIGKGKGPEADGFNLSEEERKAVLLEAAEKKRERIAREEHERTRWQRTSNNLGQAYDVLDREPILPGEPIIPAMPTHSDIPPVVLPRRSVYQWFKDFISGTDSRVSLIPEPTPQQLLDKALNDPNEYKTEEQRRYEEMVHQLTLQAERTARDARERGLSGRMARVGDYLKTFGRAAIFGVGAATIIGLTATALFASGGMAFPSIAVLAGAAMGTGTREMSKKYFEQNNYKYPSIYSTLLGLAVGLGTTAITDRIFDAFTSSPKAPQTPLSPTQQPVQPPSAPSNLFPWLSSPYTVGSGDAVARFGLDGFLNTKVLCTPLFQSLNLTDLGHDQLIEAYRAVFVHNPQFSDFFTGSSGRIINGADGLDLMFRRGDVIDPRILRDMDFLNALRDEITSGKYSGLGYRELVGNLGGPNGVASFISKLR